MNEPACWSWPLPAVRTREQEIDRLMAEQVGRPLDRQCPRGAWELVTRDWSRPQWTAAVGLPDAEVEQPLLS